MPKCGGIFELVGFQAEKSIGGFPAFGFSDGLITMIAWLNAALLLPPSSKFARPIVFALKPTFIQSTAWHPQLVCCKYNKTFSLLEVKNMQMYWCNFFQVH